MIEEQVYVFGWSIIVGAILGFLFDIFRGIRWEGIRDIWVYMQDVLFWMVTAIIILVSTFLINKGELRGYMLIGYLLGAGFYLLLFSKWVLGGFQWINSRIRKGFQFISKIFPYKVKKEKNKKIKQEN